MAKNKGVRNIDIPKLPHGEGTISIHNDTTLVYKKVIEVNGQKKRVSVYGLTIREVLDKMKAKEKELARTQVNPSKVTLADAVDAWLKLKKRPVLKAKSYDRIECTWKNQIKDTDLGELRYQSITDDDIQRHINGLAEKGYAWSTIKKVYDLLNEFYKYQSDKGGLLDNPMPLVNMVSQDNVPPIKEIKFFDEKDIKKFMIEATRMMQHRNLPAYGLGNALVFLMFTGLRAGEGIALRWSDISWNNKTVDINKSVERVINREYDELNPDAMEALGIPKYIDVEGSTKTHATRLLALNKYAYGALRAIQKYSMFTESSDYIMCTRDGSVNNITNMTQRLNIIQKAAGIKVQNSGLHVLRHTAASLMFKKGLPIEIIASLLGHSVDECRNTYLHFEQEQKAAAMNKLDGFNFDIDLE